MPPRRKAYASALLAGVVVSLTLLAISCSDGSATPSGSTGRPDAGARSDGSFPPDATTQAPDGGDASEPDGGGPAPSEAGTPMDASPIDADSSAGNDAGAPVSTTPQPLVPTTSFYPRAILLADGTIFASVVATQASSRLGATILESDDDAVSFHVVGNIDDTRMAGGLCCGTLYELPSAIGAIPAGALFWAASLGQGQSAAPMTITVWLSTDRGRSWAFSSNAAVASAAYTGTNGLWEPEFSLLDDGTLVCHYSDETDPAHSQKLARCNRATA
jgi:hypothetical protein